MADVNFVMARYMHPNRGQHRVIGPTTRLDYGYRKGGELFLVHRDDLRSNPHLFQEAEQVRVPVVTTPAPPPPGPVVPETSSGVDLHALPGVTTKIAEALSEMGVETVDQLLALGPEGLMGIKGVGQVKANMIIEAAEALKAVAAGA